MIAASTLLSGCASEQPTEVTADVTSVLGAAETAVNFESKITHEITDWTMEDLISDIEICGQQFSFPFKAADLPNGFVLDETGHYIGVTDSTGFMMHYNGEEIAYVYCGGNCKNSSEAVITEIGFGMFMPVPEINIMGIKESSSSDEVKQILGEPNYIQDDGNAYRYIFSNEKRLLVNFTDDEKAIECFIVNYAEE